MINRNIWRNSFELDSIPLWDCPNCRVGKLKGRKSDFKIIESEASKKDRNQPDWSPEYIQGGFSGVLKCTNDNCNERVVVAGSMEVDQAYRDSEFEEVPEIYFAEFFIPKYFNQPLHIIELKDCYSKEVRFTLIKSFELFWLDESSCGNKLRVVVEIILDELKVKKFTTSNDKEIPLNLHQRILELEKDIKEIDGLLLATKWIGNAGSHSTINLTRDDLLDAYEFLDNALKKLFDGDEYRIKLMSKRINDQKGPVLKNIVWK